ncbi:pyruvate decarboxylase, putative [Medicago truncatula]|uniref:Pyruvate decarboxylase, putative n=1 Tax=Medicago truncatula TaxID=3880 RepID=G7JQ59_MEDTR|nr:pyruvate decarboxylase, putative [Medicago truncatula]
MQYGSIGWSVGATLGYAQAVPGKSSAKGVVLKITNISFQQFRLRLAKFVEVKPS